MEVHLFHKTTELVDITKVKRMWKATRKNLERLGEIQSYKHSVVLNFPLNRLKRVLVVQCVQLPITFQHDQEVLHLVQRDHVEIAKHQERTFGVGGDLSETIELFD